MVKCLIENGADINSGDIPPLMLAMYKMYIGVVELLLQNGADISVKDISEKVHWDLKDSFQVKTCIPLLEALAKYKPKDVEDFLSEKQDLISKLSKGNNLGKELEEIVGEVKNTQKVSKKEGFPSRLVNSEVLINPTIEELKEIIKKSRD